MGRRKLLGAALALACTMCVAACTTTLPGKPVSAFADPFSVAGMTAADGPTGLRSNPAEPSRTVEGTDDGDIDDLARQAVSDLDEFWDQAYPKTFDDDFEQVEALISWDANGFDGRFCGVDTFAQVNAGYCHDDGTIGWDRGQLLPELQDAYGEMGVTMVLAHEYGHAIGFQAGLVDDNTPTLVAEQQADCLAGAYMRWVAEGDSPRFTLSTADGLNTVLAAVIGFRDPLLNENGPEVGVDEHGSAFERLSAFQFGFTDGASACALIDLREIGQRRGDLPVLLPEHQTGEWPVSEESVRAIVEAMNILFSPADPPELSFETAYCPGVRPRPPVSFCPATNTIAVDQTELEVMGTRTEDEDGGGLATGDNTAYSVLVSRYMQALQHQRGPMTLDNAAAALRTACLTGVATTKLSREVTIPDGNTVALTAGDVDEAVSGILINGLAASDINGDSVPSGFSRIDAFRVGVMGDEDRCFKRFP